VISVKGNLRGELQRALAEAFKPEDLEKRMMDPLGVPPELRSRARSVAERILALLDWAQANGRVDDLLRIAHDANPYSPALRRLTEALGLIPATSSLVEVMRPALPSGGEEGWLRGLAEVRRQVCRITWEGGSATGFLVGPNQVMTASSPVLVPGRPRRSLRCRFEEDGPEYAAAGEIYAKDVAVLSLDRAAGREYAQQTSEAVAARARGWVTPLLPSPSVAGTAVVVVQFHDDRLVVAADTAGLLDTSPDGRLIHYRTATHEGSSGSPCFDARWRLIGVHASHDGRRGEGYAMTGIVADLQAAGFTWTPSAGVHATTRSSPGGEGALDDVLRGVSVDAASRDSASDDVWQVDLAETGLASNDERWPWAEGAAVVACFDPEDLKPTRPAPAAGRVAVLLESQRVRLAGDVHRWMLSEKVRNSALRRLGGRGELQAARAAAVDHPDDLLDVALASLIAGQPPTPADLRDPDRLRALVQVVGWLQGVVTPLPLRDDLLVALERATLIAPFRHLTQGFFAGREAELARLRQHVDGPPSSRPLLIHGPGGVGKSALLAHFILAHSERDPDDPVAWRPFLYVDFDRPDARDLRGVLLAIARQLEPQVPQVREPVAALLERWKQQRRPLRRHDWWPSARDNELRRMIGELAALIGVVAHPLLLVFDTLEEVQYASPDAVEPLVELVSALAAQAPNLRPLLAGRLPITSAATPLELLLLGPLPAPAAEALLGNELPPALAADGDLIRRVVEVVGGNPLSLRLAAEVLRREAEQGGASAAAVGDDLAERVGDAMVQGRLYERIIRHIHDPAVRSLAYPGLVVRRITWEVIRDVLAGPCLLDAPDEAAARALFVALAREVALVRVTDDPEVLELRPELRRVVNDDFRRDRSTEAQRLQVHAAAVLFYARQRSPGERAVRDRAEEIYHRLSLDEDPQGVDRLWIDGVEPLLRGAVEELPERGRIYLANRVGVMVDASQIERASPVEWEAWAARRASDLIQFGLAERALEVLTARAERLPGSVLYLVESVARRGLAVPDLAGAEEAAAWAVAAARTSGDSVQLREALEERVQLARLRDDTAEVLRRLADLGDLGSQLGDDLILLQAEVEYLELVSPDPPEPARFSEAAVRVFARLPDDLVVRAPELARRVAAQVGADDPETLQRVLRLVGIGSLGVDAARGLEELLATWQGRDPGIASFVPGAKASGRALTSAMQYLLANRTMDRQTAGEIARWLRPVVTPLRGESARTAAEAALS
jgi:AAA ATPase domain/Trypsin-like peptidase domain/Effector-associated domain 1